MLHDTDLALARDLSTAGRVLVRHGVLDAFGHVSARATSDPTRFLLSRNRAPALVEPSDVLLHGLDGGTGTDERLYLERFIHAEIYRARPEIMAVVHSHSPGVIPFGLTDAALQPVIHTAGFLGEGVARFDTRDGFGETDLLIRDGRMGARLADALGEGALVLMRGHGSTAVGGSIPQAVYRAIYAEVNAKVQLQASALGAVTPLSPAEAAAADATNAGQVDRLWAAWSAEVDLAP